MLVSKYADELQELGFDLWDEEDRIRNADIPDFSEVDLPCFFCVRLPELDITFVIDEHRRVWAVDALIDLSYLGLTAKDFPLEGDEDEDDVEEVGYRLQ
jgi:hypothetical protein